MGLRERAAKDTAAILSNKTQGRGHDIILVDPDGNTGTLTGYSSDIGQLIDPDTGQAVSGRLVSIAVPLAGLADAGLSGVPQGVDDDADPWVVRFNDLDGVEWAFTVRSSAPDRELGIIVCWLEFYSG